MINMLDKVMLEVNQKLRGLDSKLIPDEDARINADGTLTIFVLLLPKFYHVRRKTPLSDSFF